MTKLLLCCFALFGGLGLMAVNTASPLEIAKSAGYAEYLVNGLYHFKVFDRMPEAADSAKDSGLLIRVPGEWFDFLGQNKIITDDAGNVRSKFPLPDNVNWKNGAIYGLVELDFALPKDFDGKTILLNLAGTRYLADVYFNGVKLGTQQTYHNKYYNITPLLKAQNNLKIALRCFSEVQPIFGPAGIARSNAHGGIVHDLKLIALDEPVLYRVANIAVDAAKKEAQITVRADNYSSQTISNNLDLTVSRDGKVLAAAQKTATLPPGTSRIKLDLSLDNLKLWSMENPELYDVMLSAGSMRRPLGRTGFREVKLGKLQVEINHIPLSLWGDSAARINLLMAQCVEPYPSDILNNLKALGFNYTNLLHFPTSPATLEAADRIGFYLGPVVDTDADIIFRKYAGLNSNVEQPIPDAEIADFMDQFTDLSEMYAMHPSVIAYTRMFNWLCDPAKAYDPHRVGLNEHSADARTKFAEKILAETEKIDPTRVHYLHHSGGKGPVYTHNRYWSSGLPLQEKADFIALWAADRTNDKMPLLVTEGNLTNGWPSLYPKWGKSPRNPSWQGLYGPYAKREIGAINLGSGAYRTNEIGERAILDDQIESLTRQVAAFRLHRVLGHMMHTDFYSAYAPGKMTLQNQRLDANISGFVSDNALWSGQYPSTNLNKLGLAMKQAFSGYTYFLLDAETPTAVPHNYYAGQTLRKSLLVINETPLPRRETIPVTLGKIQQELKVDLAPGERKRYAVNITLPAVKERTVMTLEAGERKFAVTVFPALEPAPVTVPTAVFDPEGSLKTILKTWGIRKPQPLENLSNVNDIKLILVGRDALNMRFAELAQTLDLARFVRDGGRIVVFEQSGSKLLGLTLDPRRERRAFIANPGHPMFANLADGDFSDWQGESSLVKPFPATPAGFHWSTPAVASTVGVVSSFPAEKPHLGNIQVLLESGFDLQFSPLLEMRAGKGLVIFCQLDVTNRIGLEPAADQLVQNLLRYAVTAKVAPARTFAVGDTSLLTKLGRTAKPLSADVVWQPGDVLVVGADAAIPQVPDFVTVLLLPRAGSGKVKLDQLTQTNLPVSLSDLYWRDQLELDKLNLAGNGLIDRSGNIVYCQLPLKLADGAIYPMKPYRLWSQILTMLNVPELTDHADDLVLAGAAVKTPLGHSARFELDPDNRGVAGNWQSPDFDDSLWQKIVVPGAWEKTPYLKDFGPPDPPAAAPGYNGIAYYRFHVDIPDYLKGKECVLQLGVIDDYDNVYVNGVRVGGLGKSFPNTWATNRAYRVPESAIRYGADNVIAVRVEDASGDGGIMHGEQQLEFNAPAAKQSQNLYLSGQSIFEIFGITPYYNEQW